MDATQILITVLALVGILVVGLLAIVPTVLDLSARPFRRSRRSVPDSRPASSHRTHVDLAA